MFLRLLLLFTVVPLVELFLLIRVGEAIGLGPTLLLVLGTGALGAWLARQQGLRTFSAVRAELNSGRLPADGLVDGLLILAAGAVLLTPGLLTDAVGFLLLIPGSRQVVRRALMDGFRRRFDVRQPQVIDGEWTREK